MGMTKSGITIVLAASLVAGCGSGLEGRQGWLGEPCYPNDTCDKPYVCRDGECVAPDEGIGGVEQPCYPNDTCDEPLVCVGETCECVPECEGRECGDDGCDGECSPGCPANHLCEDGVCECVPDCAHRECGGDGCGGVCPPGCREPDTCVGGVCECVPDCDGLECGDDGCGGECSPGCGPDHRCNDGLCEWVPQCSDGMCLVPSGAFMMGCNERVDHQCEANERPSRQVDVPEFRIDRNQVTVERYRECVNDGVCSPPPFHSGSCNWDEPGKDDHPINCLDWEHAHLYCSWAGKRLCSEAEWEKAARGTDGRKYPWGNEPVTCEHAVFDEAEGAREDRGCGTNATWPVGSRPLGESPYGALDMLGNVWDWVEDDWHDNYDGVPRDGSAWIDEPRSSWRVGRGGAFFYKAEKVRASYRGRHIKDGGFYDSAGIRCCE